jgi:hypothetical protein
MLSATMAQPHQHGSGAWGRWVLLGTAITQAATPALSSFTGDTGVELVVVPPGPFFAIWAVIIAGCLASAIWGLPRGRALTGPYARIQFPLALAQVGFSAWLIAAGASPGWTVPIFLLMLAALAWSLRQIVITPAEKATQLLLGTTVGLYTGWSAAAVWLNAATALPPAFASHPMVLALVLLGAVGTVLAGAVVFHAQAGFVAAGS